MRPVCLCQPRATAGAVPIVPTFMGASIREWRRKDGPDRAVRLSSGLEFALVLCPKRLDPALSGSCTGSSLLEGIGRQGAVPRQALALELGVGWLEIGRASFGERVGQYV